MIVYAAIDLRGGRCVQLVGGRPEDTRVTLSDPVAVAKRWRDAGFPALHVVDLDGALGSSRRRSESGPAKASRGEVSGHSRIIRAILEAVEVPVQVGGGIRDDRAVRERLNAGAARVVVGTRAIEDPEWLAAMCARYPRRLVAAVDVRGDEVVVRGWTERTGLNAGALLTRLDALPLAGVLVTDVAREGRIEGPNLNRFGELVAATRHDLTAAGSIRNAEDVRALADAGAAAAVVGMALYTGAADARALAKEFAA